MNQGIACEIWYPPECEKVPPEEYEFLVKIKIQQAYGTAGYAETN